MANIKTLILAICCLKLTSSVPMMKIYGNKFQAYTVKKDNDIYFEQLDFIADLTDQDDVTDQDDMADNDDVTDQDNTSVGYKKRSVKVILLNAQKEMLTTIADKFAQGYANYICPEWTIISDTSESVTFKYYTKEEGKKFYMLSENLPSYSTEWSMDVKLHSNCVELGNVDKNLEQQEILILKGTFESPDIGKCSVTITCPNKKRNII